MQKIMFNDHYGLTNAVLEGRKTQTRRLVPETELAKIPDFQKKFYEETLDLLEERDLLIQYFLIDKYGKTHYPLGETIAVAQSYKSIYDTIHEKSDNFGPVPIDILPKIFIKGMESLIETAKNSTVCKVLKHQDKTEIIPDTGIREHEIPAYEKQSMFRQNGENAAKEFSEQFKKQDNLPDLVRETYSKTFSNTSGWKNKMFVKADLMPHQIRVTNIRIERLQDITDEDCIKEGIIEDCPGVQYSFPTEIGYCGQYPFSTPRAAYAALIDKVSGKRTWEKNPWVFVYDLRIVQI